MISKLYRRLYLYAVFIMIAAIGLTFIMMQTLFRFDQRELPRRFMQREASLVQMVLYQTLQDHPTEMPERIQKLASEMNWQISWWKNGKSMAHSGSQALTPAAEHLQQFLASGETLGSFVNHRPELLLYLNPSQPSQGYLHLQVSFPPPPPPPGGGGPRPAQFGPGGPPPGIQGGPPPGFGQPGDRPGPRGPGPGPGMPFMPTMQDPNFWLNLGMIFGFLGLLLIPYALYVLRPFRHLMHSLEGVAEGNFSTTIDIPRNSEFYAIAEAFNRMIVKIQQMMHEKQRLIADVSHELRSPLARLRLSLELLVKEGKGKQKYIDKAIFEVEFLDQLIDNLLASSELELNPKHLQLRTRDLVQEVSASLERNQPLLATRELSMKRSFPGEAQWVEIDSQLIDRILTNLLSNLVKYAPTASQAEVNIWNSNNYVHLTLRDQGPGVAESELERIFEAFFRTDDSRSRKTGGTGLGLALVRKAVEQMNGKVWAEKPSDGEGFQIHLMFPQAVNS